MSRIGADAFWDGAGCCARACGVEATVSVLAAISIGAHSERVSTTPNWTSSLANRPVAAIACRPAGPMRSRNCSSSCSARAYCVEGRTSSIVSVSAATLVVAVLLVLALVLVGGWGGGVCGEVRDSHSCFTIGGVFLSHRP